METKRHSIELSYRIEKQPDGSFVAKPSGSGMETLSAPTQEELTHKIEAVTEQLLEQQLPSLLKQSPAEGKLASLLSKATAVKVKANTQVVIKRAEGQGAAGLLPSAPATLEPQVLRATQPDRSGTILRIVAALIALAALLYFILHR